MTARPCQLSRLLQSSCRNRAPRCCPLQKVLATKERWPRRSCPRGRPSMSASGWRHRGWWPCICRSRSRRMALAAQ
eukprot:3792156-Heterocapsa_arctica.AAC.1